MRQKKSFFTKNNSLDKVGSIKEPKVTEPNNSLLDAKTLADFEKVSPGFSEKLFAMAKNEQSHLQKMDDIKSSMSKNAHRMGRISFVFVFIVICYFSYSLILNNMANEGYIFAAISFASLLMLNCSGRKQCSKPEVKHKSPNNPKQFRKPSQKRRNFKRK